MADWDFHHEAVEDKEREHAAMQIGSKAILIGFGPPKFDDSNDVVLSGFIQNLNLNQQKQIREIFEIGSGARFYVDGPTRNNLSIGRALYSGASILKLIGTGLTGSSLDDSDITGVSDIDTDEIFASGEAGLDSVATDFEDAHWLNLGSSFFNNPLGIYLEYGYFDGAGQRETYSASYLENCKVRSLSTNMQAGQWLTQEQVQIQFANIVPIEGEPLDDEYYDHKEELVDEMYGGDDLEDFKKADLSGE